MVAEMNEDHHEPWRTGGEEHLVGEEAPSQGSAFPLQPSIAGMAQGQKKQGGRGKQGGTRPGCSREEQRQSPQTDPTYLDTSQHGTTRPAQLDTAPTWSNMLRTPKHSPALYKTPLQRSTGPCLPQHSLTSPGTSDMAPTCANMS